MPSILCFYYQCFYKEAVRIRETAEKFEVVTEKFRNKVKLKFQTAIDAVDFANYFIVGTY